MRAVIVESPGGVESLQLQELPEPSLPPDCLRISIKAAALNRADLLQRRGLYPPPAGATDILGLECAGEVVEVGTRVNARGGKPWAIGERAMALLVGGGYADQVVVPAAHALRIPRSLSFTQAAAIPEAFLTAQEALFSLGELQRNQLVLIHAAAGGVGSAAVQLAHQHGARVVATAGTSAKRNLAIQLGADVAVDYREDDFATECNKQSNGQGVNVVLDFVGAKHASAHQQCLASRAKWVVVGVMGGARTEINFAKLLANRWSILGLVMRSRSDCDKEKIVSRFRETWLPLFDNQRLQPVVDKTFPLENVAEAHLHMEANANRGKIILTM